MRFHQPKGTAALLGQSAFLHAVCRCGGDIQSFTADRLFASQTPEFFQVVMDLAQQADAAQREL
ncbi:MAG: hypothetical protein JO150_17055 [Acidobacteriaceae bacterium]|nr:hypothetical protein [Acidobacteriaceae bacterium]